MRKSENMELKRIIDILKSKALVVIFILVCFTALGYFYSYYYVVPKYQSTATLLLIPNETSEENSITTADLNLNSELITTYSNIAKQPKVLKQAIQNLGLNMTEQELLNNMQVKVLTSTYIIEITITNTNAQLAKNITQEVSNVFLDEIQEIYHLNNIGVVDEANVPQTPYNIHHTKDMITFFAIGIVASAIVVMGVYIFDNTIQDEDEIEKYIHIKSLGKVPVNNNQKHEIINRNSAKSYITECLNTIRTNILYMNAVQGSKAILVTSCMPKEGKSWISTNIAATFAQTNKKVLLIDCDMRKGRQHKIFNIANDEGLSNYLYEITGDIKKDAKLGKNYIKETHIPNLHILTNGTTPPNPAELIDSIRMKELISIMKKVYDIVIIDAPPCKLVTDSIILSRIVDSTILVASSEKTKINDLRAVKKSIENVNGKIIGGILNQVRITQKAYGNTYYYGHHKKEDEATIKQRQFISVDQIIKQALPKLEEKTVNILEEIQTQKEEKTGKEIQNRQIQESYQKQNEHLKSVVNALTDIKKELKSSILENELNNKEKEAKLEEMLSKKMEEYKKESTYIIKSEIQNINYENELNQISDNLKNINYQEELNQISANLKNINYQDELNQISNNLKNINYADELNQISDNLKSINYQDELNQISNNLKNINYTDELTQISGELENVKTKFNSIHSYIENIEKSQLENHNILQDKMQNINYSNELTQISNELENMKAKFSNMYEYIEAMKQELLTKEQFEEKELTKKQLEEIMKQEISRINYLEQMEKMSQELQTVKANFNVMYDYMEGMKNALLTKEQIQDLVLAKASANNQENVTQKQLSEMMKQELARINYTEQISQINDKMMSLQDNYLEILNLIKEKQLVADDINGENVIDMKSFKKQSEKKKRVYTVPDEVISYEELEKTACYVIPLNQGDNPTSENYDNNFVAMR